MRMLFTEHRLWRGTVIAVTALVVALSLGTPALAVGLFEGWGTAFPPGQKLSVPVGDFERAGDRSTSAAQGAGGKLTQAQPPSGKAAANSRAAARERIKLRRGDLDILAHLVRAEAGDESYRGKVAVAAVVLNRVLSGRFPNSVYGVVFEQDAFEPVSNGWYWNPPKAVDYQAVREALRGSDPTHGALFFFNPAKTANAFVWSRPAITQIGNHLFTR